jgi:anaerobic selenocysteine-containing dehydrogenase
MGIVHSSTGVLKPCSDHLLSEPAIIAGMAAATLGEHFPVKWQEWISNYDIIRDHISKTIPGFEDFNKRIIKPGGFYLPNRVRQGEFPTPNGKANFSINRFQEWKLAEGRYLMMTIRSHDQFNTTIYGLEDRYRGLSGDRWIALMNEDDMRDEKLNASDHVMIASHYKGVVRKAGPFRIIPYPIPRSCVGTYFPEANVLIPLESRAHTSKTPTSKSVEISLEKV